MYRAAKAQLSCKSVAVTGISILQGRNTRASGNQFNLIRSWELKNDGKLQEIANFSCFQTTEASNEYFPN